MSSISIEELKKKLSVILKQATQGEVFHITKHNRPVALLLGEGRIHLHRGVRCSGAKLTPLLHRATQGVYLEVLEQDRTESPLGPGS